MASQLNNLLTTEMLKTMFPHLNTLANVCMTIPVGTASVERSFASSSRVVRIQAIETVDNKHINHAATVCQHIVVLSKTHIYMYIIIMYCGSSLNCTQSEKKEDRENLKVLL